MLKNGRDAAAKMGVPRDQLPLRRPRQSRHPLRRPHHQYQLPLEEDFKLVLISVQDGQDARIANALVHAIHPTMDVPLVTAWSPARNAR